VYALGIRIEAELALGARARQAENDLRVAIDAGRRLLNRVRALAEDTAARRPVFSPQALAWLAMCEAEFSRLEGASDADLWATAAAAWEALGMPYPRAYALMREAQAALASRMDRARVAGAVLDAYAIADRLGAKPLLGKIEEIAARAGVRLGSLPTEIGRAPTGATPDGPSPGVTRTGAARNERGRYELTRRELEVLDLLAGGRSDGEIAAELYISKKTVSVHIGNIKGKLGAESRLEIVTSALSRRLIETPSPRSART
jgi:DNA-binding CsgD family transcriptional regulator